MWKHKNMFKGKTFKGKYFKRGKKRFLLLTCGLIKKEFKSIYDAKDQGWRYK